MVEPVRFPVKADRWVRVRRPDDGGDPPFSLDGDGFLAEPGDGDDGWVRPADAAASGGWVLLGEPGAGKTTAFAQLVPDQEPESDPVPGSGGTVWLTGADLYDAGAADARLGMYLDALPSKADAEDTAGPDPLLIVIDQLDESAFLANLPVWLDRRLRSRDARSLRIWIACRTAEYPDRIGVILERELGRCVVGDLAPLTRGDAADLVAGTGADAEAFLVAVTGNGVGPLAAIPLTLKVLLDVYRQDPGVLGDQPLALFGRSVDVLVSEPDGERMPRRPSETTVEQRVAVAARIAAHLLLSGRRWVHTHVLDDLADQAVPLGQVVGAHETAGAGSFAVTKMMVEETLATAVFTRTGQGRVAFAHSSFAAFLAARYLAARLTGPAPIPRRQLEGFFLVSAPDEDTAAIPGHLREVAAWLLAHAPAQVRWLAAADPEALTAHTTIITDPEIRRILVDGLLARADRIELVDRAWHHARWNLRHPTFADQLVQALDDITSHPVVEWSAHARARLALRLAGDSGLTTLAGPLLRLVENEQWPVYLRQRAARTTMALDPGDTTVSRLRAVLSALALHGDEAGPFDEVKADSPAELAGTLLRLLWPVHLSFAEAAAHIRPGVTGIWGSYHAQVVTFADQVPDADIEALVAFTEQTLAECGVIVGEPDIDAAYEDIDDDNPTVPVPSHTTPVIGSDRSRRLRTFVLRVTDRVLRAPNGRQLLDRVARMLLWFLSASQRAEVPAPIDLVDDDGTEPEHVRELRREFAEALLRAAHRTEPEHRDYWTYRVFAAWRDSALFVVGSLPEGAQRGHRTQLLDNEDADWAASRSHHYRTTDAALADTFDAVATALARKPEEPTADVPAVWEMNDEFATAQRSRLDDAAAGDPTAFWKLVKNLGVNPTTGHRESHSSWKPAAFAGAGLWQPEELAARMHAAAVHYLTREHDHREQWLGIGGDWRAHAAMVAFAAVRATPADETGEEYQSLETVPVERWKYWVGAILDRAGYFGPDSDLDRDLLDYATRHAPAEFAEALIQYVRTRFTYGETPTRLPALPPSLTPTLRDLAIEALTALRNTDCANSTSVVETEPTVVTEGSITPGIFAPARRPTLAADWADLLGLPLATGDPTVVGLARNTITAWVDYADPELGLQVAVRSAHALLVADAAEHWPFVRDQIAASAEFARELALGCAIADDTQVITDALIEQDLADLYRWLATVCPPESEVYGPGVRIVSAELEVHQWRRNTVTKLARRGTPDAVHALRRLTDDYPDLLDIQFALHDARRTVQTKAAVRLTPGEVTALLTDHHRRVVRSANQLAAVIVETLDDIAADLHTHGNLLWDCERGTPPPDARSNSPRPLEWRPKAEGALGAYIAHELHLRLVVGRVVVNREVMIRPTDHGDSGERPDIKIDVVSPDDTAESPVISVPIEIKGAWHGELLTAQADQLANRYLADMDTTDGIYLVGWYPLDYWNTTSNDDRRRSKAASREPVDQLQALLSRQAEDILGEIGRRTHPYILTVPRAVSAEDRPVRTRLRRPSR